MSKEKLVRKVSFTPAFDKRHAKPEKNYGIHGVEIRFSLSGKKGAIVWGIYTDWLLKKTLTDKSWPGFKSKSFHDDGMPMGGRTGMEIMTHSHEPQFVSHTKSTDECNFVGKEGCYYNAEFLAGGELFDVLIEQGEEAMWKVLEDRYKAIE